MTVNGSALDQKMAALRAPFSVEDVQWRAGATNRENTKALALGYIDARAVMDRLDEVLGPMNWMDTYEEWRTGAVKAGIGIRAGGDALGTIWIWKFDGADETNFESTKGGFSDAFKRAAVKWGIGRYLYQLPGMWVPCQKSGNTVKLSETPTLPPFALPGGKSVKPKTNAPDGQPQGQGNGNGRRKIEAWILDENKRKSFWAGVHDRGLTNDFIHQALGVQSLKDYHGSISDAWVAINEAIPV